MINLSDYTDFFIFLGGLLLTAGVVYALFGRRLQNLFISEEDISRLRVSKQVSIPEISFITSSKNTDSQALMKKLSVILLVIIIGAFLFNQFLMWRMNSSGFLNKLFNINITVTKK